METDVITENITVPKELWTKMVSTIWCSAEWADDFIEGDGDGAYHLMVAQEIRELTDEVIADLKEWEVARNG